VRLRADASRGGGRRRAGSRRHEPDLLSTSRLSRSDALAPRRRRSLSTQSHPPVRRLLADALSGHRNAYCTLQTSRPSRHRGGLVLACRPSSTSAPTLNLHSTRCQPVLNFPRLRALALFGRRPAQSAERLVVAGVQKPAHKQTRAPQRIARLAHRVQSRLYSSSQPRFCGVTAFTSPAAWPRSVWRVCDAQCAPMCFRAIGSDRFPDD
jgi:hypothetical protein